MIAILGTGKMGEALMSGLLRAGRSPAAVVAAVPAPRYSPTAVGLTETSAAPPRVSPSAPSSPSSCTYSSVTAAAWARSLVSSPR